MFLINFRSRVNRNSKVAEKYGDIGGAYVNCYIQFKDYEVAEKLAKLLIREHGFIPEKRTDGWRLQKKGIKTKKQRQFYDEAVKYGYTLVFNLWPKDAEDADVDYESDAVKSSRRLKPRLPHLNSTSK